MYSKHTQLENNIYVLCTLCIGPAFQHIGDLLNSSALFGQGDPQAKTCWGGHCFFLWKIKNVGVLAIMATNL